MSEHCPYCDAKISNRTERLTKGLCLTLIKFWEKSGHGRRAMHLLKECEFTTNEINNFQKLRYFNLVYRDLNPGKWRMTPYGDEFVLGTRRIIQTVEVFRNKVVKEHSDLASITDVLKTEPYWLQRGDYAASASFGAADSLLGPLFQ